MKRFISILAVLALALCLFAGCGSDGTASSNASGTVDDSIFSTDTVKFLDENGESVYTLDGAYGNEKKYTLGEGETFNDTFHTFGFLWDEDEHTFTCDGQAYFSYKNNETEEDRDGLHLLSFIRLSAAIGFQTLGVVIADDDPAWTESNQLIADYVHIYQLQDGKQILHTK